MPEGLLHRNRCVESISWVYPTPLTAGSIISLAFRSRSLWCKVVVERPPQDGGGGLQNKLNAAELLLGRLGHASIGRGRCAEPTRRAIECCYVSRSRSHEGSDKTPTLARTSITLFACAVSVLLLCGVREATGIRPGGTWSDPNRRC